MRGYLSRRDERVRRKADAQLRAAVDVLSANLVAEYVNNHDMTIDQASATIERLIAQPGLTEKLRVAA